MGGKHLKRIRAEKAKVKLKKKTLPKGQNITDTTFKVKKIVMVEQLKKVDENEPVTSWNLPLKDLLIRLGHYNQNSKFNSLSGVKELVTNHPEILRGPLLKQLITKVLEVLADEEPRVRKAAVDLIGYLFDCLPTASIIPFYDILNVHLGCALTHRNASIQKDSLRLIDVMITHTPEAIKQNFKSILQNFMRIIKSSLHRSSSELSPMGANLEKTRSEMLLRFYNILSTIYTAKKEGMVQVRTIHVNNNEQMSLRGLNDYYKKIPDLSGLFKSHRESITSNFDVEEYKQQVAFIMPLLFDTWIESCPDQKSEKFVRECVLPKPVGELLLVILKIIMLLYDKAVEWKHSNLESWFVSSYSATFKKSFLFGFPYLPSAGGEKLASNELSHQKFSGYRLQNLIVCYLAYSLKVVHNNPLSGKMENYISDALSAKNPMAVDILSKVVEAIFKTSNRTVLLKSAIQAYNETASSELREMLSKVLTWIVLNEINIYQNNKNLNEWMALLPEQLLRSSVSFHIIEAILTAIRRSLGSRIIEKVEQISEEILRNLANVEIVGIDQLEGRKLIADVLYWCDEPVIRKLQNTLSEMDSLPPNLKTYIMNIFSYRLSR